MGKPFQEWFNSNLALDKFWLQRIQSILSQVSLASNIKVNYEASEQSTSYLDFLTTAKLLHLVDKILLESARKIDWMTSVGDYENLEPELADDFHKLHYFSMFQNYRLDPSQTDYLLKNFSINRNRLTIGGITRKESRQTVKETSQGNAFSLVNHTRT